MSIGWNMPPGCGPESDHEFPYILRCTGCGRFVPMTPLRLTGGTPEEWPEAIPIYACSRCGEVTHVVPLFT